MEGVEGERVGEEGVGECGGVKLGSVLMVAAARRNLLAGRPECVNGFNL